MLTALLSFEPDPDIWTVHVLGRSDDMEPVRVNLKVRGHVPCPDCGERTAVTHLPPVVVADLPYGDRPVLIRWSGGSVACRCGHRGALSIPAVRRGSSGVGWTDGLARYLVRRAGDTTDDLRERTGLPNTRIRQLTRQGLRALRHDPPTSLAVVGIDELYFGRNRYTVITDISRRRLLACVPVASTVDGLSDRIDLSELLLTLPQPRTVTVDMNPTVLQVIRRVWPRTAVVIDKRHLLQTADRAYRRAIREVINARQGRPADSFQPLYGEAAYQSYRLRDLMTMRAASCTVADLAMWRLIFLEKSVREGQGDPTFQSLGDLYLLREQLYDHFSEPLSSAELSRRLRDWSQQVSKWSENGNSGLGNSLLMLRIHESGVLAYTDDRVTNAFTESVNARLRGYIRRGRRFSSETLVALVNEDLSREPAARVAPATRLAAAWADTDPEVEITVSLPVSTDGSVAECEPVDECEVALPVEGGPVEVTPVVSRARAASRFAVVNRNWPAPVRRWLQGQPSRVRRATEGRLVQAAPVEDRPALLETVRSADAPLPDSLERAGLLMYLRTLPNSGLLDHQLDLDVFLTGDVSLPVWVGPVVTELAREVALGGGDSAAFRRSRAACRNFTALQPGQAEPAEVLERVDRLRRALLGSVDYVGRYAHLMRIDERSLAWLLGDVEARWIIASWTYDRENISWLERLGSRLIELHEHYDNKKTRGREKSAEFDK